MRRFQRLTTLSITRAKTSDYIHDGGGLYLQVAPAGSKSWIFRFSLAGKRREMGLGPYPGVSLAAARQLASSAHSLVTVLACSLATAYVPDILVGRMVGKRCGDFNA